MNTHTRFWNPGDCLVAVWGFKFFFNIDRQKSPNNMTKNDHHEYQAPAYYNLSKFNKIQFSTAWTYTGLSINNISSMLAICDPPSPLFVRISFWLTPHPLPRPELMLFMDNFSGKIVVKFAMHKSFMNAHLCHFQL